PEVAGLRLARASAGSLVVIDLSAAGRYRHARRLLDELRALARTHLGEEALLHRWAMAAASLAIMLPDGALKLHRQQQMLQLLTDAASERAHDHELQLQRARTLAAMGDTWMEISLSIARGLYVELASLAAGFPDEPRLREVQAGKAERLAVRYGLKGKFHMAGQLYGELMRLVDAHPEEAALRASRARAAAELASACSRAGDTESVRFLHESAAELAARHPGEAEPRRARTRVSALLAQADTAAGRRAEARALFDEARALAAALPDDGTRRDEEAAVLGCFAAAWARAGWLDESHRTYVELAALGRASPGDDRVRESWKLAAQELLPLVGTGDAPGEFKRLLEADLASTTAALP
ncbi:MAG TPA: hypothetical protein VF263_02050, partial [Longimicrobiaceae bacterium]